MTNQVLLQDLDPISVAVFDSARAPGEVGRLAPGQMHAYEVTLYNREVREYLKSNREHPHYHERWGDLQRLILLAVDEHGLAERLEALYPSDEGFMLVDYQKLI